MLSQINTTEGPRLFASGVSSQQESKILALLHKQAIGLTLGYRQRLRLVGIGFRVVPQNVDFSQSKNVIFPDFTRSTNVPSQITSNAEKTNQTSSALIFKLGYSHDIGYILNSNTLTKVKKVNEDAKDKIQINTSRPEGRTKGTLICIQGPNKTLVSSVSSNIRAYRYPDSYKGKGIHKDGERLTLKKGKRQG